MNTDARAALFLMLGQAAERTVSSIKDIVPQESLLLSPSYDLAASVPEKVKLATDAAETYRLFLYLKISFANSWWMYCPRTPQYRGGKKSQKMCKTK